MTQFLIRTNVEDEGWTTDGIFGPDEARDQVAAILRSEQIARKEGHLFEYRVFSLDADRPHPTQMVRRADRGASAIFSEIGLGGNVLIAPLPAPKPLDY